jgi:hypothetical protein
MDETLAHVFLLTTHACNVGGRMSAPVGCRFDRISFDWISALHAHKCASEHAPCACGLPSAVSRRVPSFNQNEWIRGQRFGGPGVTAAMDSERWRLGL